MFASKETILLKKGQRKGIPLQWQRTLLLQPYIYIYIYIYICCFYTWPETQMDLSLKSLQGHT